MVVLLPLVGFCLADVVGNVVAVVIATCLDYGRCCATIGVPLKLFVAEGTVVPVADVIGTLIYSLADVIARWQME